MGDDDLLQNAFDFRRRWFGYLIGVIDKLCESPIERRMAVALLGSNLASLGFVTVQSELPTVSHGFYVVPQFKVGHYRIDLVACFFDEKGTQKLAIECDGHDYHERTKEQAAHDKARDRYLLEQGWAVMRFTGSEIHKDALACANQVSNWLYNQCCIARRTGTDG